MKMPSASSSECFQNTQASRCWKSFSLSSVLTFDGHGDVGGFPHDRRTAWNSTCGSSSHHSCLRWDMCLRLAALQHPSLWWPASVTCVRERPITERPHDHKYTTNAKSFSPPSQSFIRCRYVWLRLGRGSWRPPPGRWEAEWQVRGQRKVKRRQQR